MRIKKKCTYSKKNALIVKKYTFFSPCKLESIVAHVKLLGFSEYFNGISSEFAYHMFLILDKFGSNTGIDERNYLRNEEEGDL